MGIENERFVTLPYSARLFSNKQFRSTDQDIQAGISGKISCESVPFLWVCLMGLSDSQPNEAPLLQLELRMHVINYMLYENVARTLYDIRRLQL